MAVPGPAPEAARVPGLGLELEPEPGEACLGHWDPASASDPDLALALASDPALEEGRRLRL